MKSRDKALANVDMSLFAKAKDLKSKILFTILCLVVFRIGSYIPLPGIDSMALEELTKQNSTGILGMFNMLSGGSLGRMSIFALSIVPYITASIIVQLLTSIYKPLEELKNSGDKGRKTINQITRFGTVFLSLVQGFGIAVGLESVSTGMGSVVLYPGVFFKISTTISLSCGTIFLMWIGEQISNRGIGNGISLVIFTGIVAGLPASLGNLFQLGKTGALSSIFIIFIAVFAAVLIYFISFVEKAQRRLVVQYPKRQVGNKIFGGESSYLPIKLNLTGVIPPIFASSLLLFPLTIANFSKGNHFLESIMLYLGHGKPLYIILYAFLIIFFAFFYTSIVFNPTQTADNLKKHGGFLPGIRPGNNTAVFLDYTTTRVTVLGSLYLAFVCILPEILISKFAIPFYLGGTSLLIVVNVVTDTVSQVQTHLFAHQYEKLMKKSKLIKRKA